MNNGNRFVAAVSLAWGLLIGAPAVASAAVEDPQELVRQTANQVLSDVTAKKQELESNPRKILKLVEKTVAPHFDFQAMTRLAMGRYWRQASDREQERLSTEFKDMLVRTYGSALLSYSGQEIQYQPVLKQSDAERVTIPTRVTQRGAPSIPIDYRLHRNDGKWKVYDVVIDGVSLVTNYRSSFASEVRRGGIEGLIQTLAERNRKQGDG